MAKLCISRQPALRECVMKVTCTSNTKQKTYEWKSPELLLSVGGNAYPTLLRHMENDAGGNSVLTKYGTMMP